MNLLEYLYKAKECGYETLVAAYTLMELNTWSYNCKDDIKIILNQLKQMGFTYIDNDTIKIKPDVSIDDVINKTTVYLNNL